MRLLNSCRFKKFCSLLTVMLLMLFSVIPASAAELSTDTNIDVSVSTSGVTWNTALSGGAQKAAFTFKPGINFQCPSNKSSVSVTANASYTLESWDSGREEISLNKSFTCYPDRVS